MIFGSRFINNTVVCSEKKEVDLDILNLLAAGEIHGLCVCSYKNEKKHHHFIYETENMPNLTMPLSFEKVMLLLSEVSKLLKNVKSYDLVLDNIKIGGDYIFENEGIFKFIYIPIKHKAVVIYRDFILKLTALLNSKDERVTTFVRQLKKIKDNDTVLAFLEKFVYSYGVSNETGEAVTSLLSSDAFLAISEADTSLLSKSSEKVAVRVTVPHDEETTILSKEAEEVENGEVSYTMNSQDFTEVYYDASSEYETTVLTSQPVVNLFTRADGNKTSLILTGCISGEEIHIDVTPFAIGKESANVDYVLNNQSVSRCHATIFYECGEYYIVDNNSTNGTLVEGIRLQPNEKCKIENGYIISLGNESLQAHIERE